MTTPDAFPQIPSPEQLPPFDRAITNMQEVLDSSPRTRVPEEDMLGDMKRQITFGVYTVSEHAGEDGQTRYRTGTTGDLVWVFDPETKTVHEGRQDPAFDLELTGMQDPSFNLEFENTKEVGSGSYSSFTDQLPQLFAAAKANKQVGYPQSALSAAIGRLGLKRRKQQ